MAKITNVSQLIAQFGGGVKSPISPEQEKPAAKAAAIAKSKLQAPVAQPKAKPLAPAITQVPVKGSEKMRAAPKLETPRIPSPPTNAVAPSVRTTSKQIKEIQGTLAQQPKAILPPVPTPAMKKPLSPPAKKAPPRPQQSAAEALAQAKRVEQDKDQPRVAPKTAAPPRPLPAPKETPGNLKLHRMFREEISKTEIEAGEEFARILSEDAQKTDALDALLLTVITTPKKTSQTLIDTIKQKYPTVISLMNKRFEEFVGQLEENIPGMSHDERKELLEKIMALPKGPEKEILLGAIARAYARETIFMAINPKVLKESQDIESSSEEKKKKSERAKHAASDLAGPGRKIAEAVFKEVESDFSKGLLPRGQQAAFLKLKGEWEAACKKNAKTPTAEGS